MFRKPGLIVRATKCSRAHLMAEEGTHVVVLGDVKRLPEEWAVLSSRTAMGKRNNIRFGLYSLVGI